jgi:hypothetical protein
MVAFPHLAVLPKLLVHLGIWASGHLGIWASGTVLHIYAPCPATLNLLPFFPTSGA